MKLLHYAAASILLSGLTQASETDYSSFDQDLEALVSGRLAETGGPHLSGYMTTRLSFSDDRGPQDLLGFTVPDARLSMTGERGGYGYKVQVDFASGNILKDAYFDIPVNDLSVRAGLFKPGISRNGLNSSAKLFFIERTEIGDLFDNRDAGAMLTGDYDQLHFALMAMNGTDATGDELFAAARASFDFLGAGIGQYEGSYSAPDEMAGTVALAYYDDGDTTDGSGILLEAHVASSQFSAGIEILSADDGGVSAAPGGSTLVDDSTAKSLYGTYMLTPDKWELGLRFQDIDDANDTTRMEVGISNYIDGHNLKYSIGYTGIDSDNAGIEGNLLQVQFLIAF